MIFKDRYEGDYFDYGFHIGRILQWRTEKKLEYYFSIFIQGKYKESRRHPMKDTEEKCPHTRHYILFIAFSWEHKYIRHTIGRELLPD